MTDQIIDRARIIAIITNFVHIEDDSEEWQSPSPHIVGKARAADEILAVLAKARLTSPTAGDEAMALDLMKLANAISATTVTLTCRCEVCGRR